MPITLTEAFGCDRCQQLFVVEENGYVLEQLSTSHPYKKAWRWMGNRWSTAQPRLEQSYLPVTLGIIIVLLIFYLPFALRLPSNANITAWIMVPLLVLVLPALMIWLTYRR